LKVLNGDVSAAVSGVSSANDDRLPVLAAPPLRRILLLDPLLQHELYGMLRDLAAGGSTIFMSSHNLHEVEEVCSRVAIIRSGKLVAVESIRSLKQKKVYGVRVSFVDEVKAAQVGSWGLPGLTVKVQKGSDVHLHYSGDINALLARLADERLLTVDIAQAPLEDIFIEYYEG